MVDKPKPSDPSSDHEAMKPYWDMVSAIMGGAKTMRESARTYLPKFPHESEDDYQFRCRTAKFTNVFRDIVENLAQRPFSQEVTLHDDESAPQWARDFIEDVDGRGNNLHVFAGTMMFEGIARAVDWVLVDYTSDVPENATRAQEAEIGARPYWVRVPAQNLLAAYSDVVGGREEFTHVRIWEPVIERDGFKEIEKKRVRVFNREPMDGGGYAPATYQVFELQKDAARQSEEWVPLFEPRPVTIGVIPLVPFLTGRRKGGTWRLYPAMQDAADLQIELFQQESGLKEAKTMTAFPVLAGNGVVPEYDADDSIKAVPVGPKSVLFAPPGADGNHGEWRFIEPTAESLRFLAEDIKDTIRELRELGRQPLTAQSGNLTVVTTAFAAQKGNAAIQAWTLNLKDALENAFRYTAMWLREAEEPEVSIDTDFDLGFGDDDSFSHVLAMKAQRMISRAATISEAKRRAILSADYDGKEDIEEILNDTGDDDLSDGEFSSPPNDPDGSGRNGSDDLAA